MSDTKATIRIRDYKPEGDRNFILATWLRGLYYGDSWFREIPKDIFMSNYHRVLEQLLTRQSLRVRVACLGDDPDVIVGYAVYRDIENQSVLDWLFVKSAWRRIGIGKSLLPPNLAAVTHLTKIGKSLLASKIPGVVFNPFLV